MMLKWMLPSLIEKKQQAEIAITWQAAHASAESSQERERLFEAANKQLKHLKHEGTPQDPHVIVS